MVARYMVGTPRDRQEGALKKFFLLLKNCLHRRFVSRVLSPK
jgi:hypothetical protein